MKKLIVVLLGFGCMSLACADDTHYIDLNQTKVQCDNGHRIEIGSAEKDLVDSCKGYKDTSASNEDIHYDHLQGTVKKKGLGNKKQTVFLRCSFKKDSGDIDYKLTYCKYDNKSAN